MTPPTRSRACVGGGAWTSRRAPERASRRVDFGSEPAPKASVKSTPLNDIRGTTRSLRTTLKAMRLLVVLCALTASSCSFLGGGGGPTLRKARPTLPVARFLMQAEASAASEDDQSLPSAAAGGPLAKLKEALPCAATRRTATLPPGHLLTPPATRRPTASGAGAISRSVWPPPLPPSACTYVRVSVSEPVSRLAGRLAR